MDGKSDNRFPEDIFRERRRREAYVKKNLWRKLKRFASRIPMVSEVVAMYFCALDEKTPLWAKATAFACLAYVIFPLDAIPDLIPVVGFTDDAGAIAAAMATLESQISDEHRQKARHWLRSEFLAI